MRRGELYRVHRPGADPKPSRVFVVVSRHVVLESKFSTVICAPVFSSGEGLSTQVRIGHGEGLKHDSSIMCDNLVSLRKADLTDYVGSLSVARVTALNAALRVALDVE